MLAQPDQQLESVFRLRRFGDELPGLFLITRVRVHDRLDDRQHVPSVQQRTDVFNFGPTNHYQRPDRRYSLGAMGHYELTEHADVYTQLMFTDY